jgi:molecular chaperone DnaK
MVFQAEKTLGEIVDKVDAADKASVQSALDDLKATIPGGNTDDIKAKTEALEKAFYALSEKLYAQQGANGAAGANGDAGNAGGDDTYYNAEYEDKTNE